MFPAVITRNSRSYYFLSPFSTCFVQLSHLFKLSFLYSMYYREYPKTTLLLVQINYVKAISITMNSKITYNYHVNLISRYPNDRKIYDDPDGGLYDMNTRSMIRISLFIIHEYLWSET